MYRLTSKLIIYREIGEDSILMRLSDVCRQFDRGDYDKEALTAMVANDVVDYCLLYITTEADDMVETFVTFGMLRCFV